MPDLLEKRRCNNLSYITRVTKRTHSNS
ncbi:hypothetical protein A5868_000676, partial [Enterococcus sp. 12F9_DIV0723]